MKILAGGPARETESALFRLHEERLAAQNGFQVEVRHEIVAPVAPEPCRCGHSWDAHTPELVDGGCSECSCTRRSPRWPVKQVERVAEARQKFLDAGSKLDGLFMVDTDIILGPNVLERLWEVDADVVYGVFWSVWPGWDVPMPQVWDMHPYAHSESFVRQMGAPGVFELECYGGGACTLFRNRAFESRYFPLMPGLVVPGFYGEDRHYCVGLEARGIKQVAVFGLPIFHLYREEQQTPAALAEARERTK